jgi:formylmethanofuran dehydrogenase subunit E
MQNRSSKFKNKKNLEKAVEFHGHLGPYLVLGLLAGGLALKKLRCRRYFGLSVKIWGANRKPESCLIDGLQLSTGATYGKGNICRYNGRRLRISARNLKNRKDISIFLKKDIMCRLDMLKGHRDSEIFARRLYQTDPTEIFILRTNG